jgi:DNA topoisomerase-1
VGGRLRRSDPSAPGISRRRRGKGFSYHWQADGSPVTDGEVLERIASLAIPPAWRDVWICPWPHGHIQALGTDAAGRRQYRYHDAWRRKRDLEKFERMIRFGRALPGLRKRVEADLALRGFAKDKVLAAAVRLLDIGYFRIGGEEYAEENESFGLATLERSHVAVRGARMHFVYPAKSGKERDITVVDDDVAKLLKSLRKRKGGNEDLLAWREGREWVDLRADDVNAYVKATIGDEFSAKDFRTWSATVLASVGLAVASPDASRTAGRRLVTAVCKEVSSQLGNTPAVCRASYVDPRVFDRHEAGETIRRALGRLDSPAGVMTSDARQRIEAAVIDLLEEERREQAA